jgi:hypothetical protein
MKVREKWIGNSGFLRKLGRRIAKSYGPPRTKYGKRQGNKGIRKTDTGDLD